MFKMSVKRFFKIISIILILFITSGCGGTNTTNSTSGGKLTIGFPSEPLKLDPASSGDWSSGTIYDYIVEGLYGWDNKGALVPILATSSKFSDDGKQFIVQVRQNVKFQDGTDLDSQAVKVNFDRIMNPDLKLVGSSSFKGIIESVDAVDKYTVRFNLVSPHPSFAFDLANSYAKILSPNSLARSQDELNSTPIGTGPFSIVSWTPHQQIDLKAFNGYWGEHPKLDSIIFKFIPDASTRVAAMESGDVDVAISTPIQDASRLHSDNKYQIFAGQGAEAYHYEINMEKGPLKDIRVRLALNYAIDKQSIVANIYQGYASELDSPISALIPGHVSVGTYSYSPEKAKQLLSEAGYATGLKLVLWSTNGRYTMERQLSDAVAGYLKDVGVDVEITTMDFGTYLDKIRNPPQGIPPEYDLALWNAQPGSGEPNMIWKMFVASSAWPPNFYNIGFYSNPEVDTLIQQAATTLDETQRNKIHAEIQNKVWGDAPWIFLVSPQQISIGSSTINGAYFTQFGINFKQAWLEP